MRGKASRLMEKQIYNFSADYVIIQLWILFNKLSTGSKNMPRKRGMRQVAEEIRPELHTFLKPTTIPLHILVVESLSYLPQLRQMFPRAALYAVTADPDRRDEIDLDGIHWQILDYLQVPLPYMRGYFDYILADLVLEQSENPQDIAAGFSMFLQETGSLLTSFRNIRHWSVLQNLMEGHYYNVVSRLFARPEFESLLYASFYKNVYFRVQQRAAPKELLDRLLAAEFANRQGDLETEFYLVRADRSMPELSLLKSMYTSAERAQMARLIHRVEYGVAMSDAVYQLWETVECLGVFPDYLAAFSRETVMHTASFYQRLVEEAPEHIDFIADMLKSSYDESVNSSDRACYQSLYETLINENAEVVGDDDD